MKNLPPVPRASRMNSRSRQPRGVILPIALIMLVIISFVGLMAARNSASYEQFSNNMRTSQVARQAAEAALRHCERVAIDHAENEGKDYEADAARIITATPLDTPENLSAAWNTKANWVGSAANLISVTPNHSSTVRDNAQLKHDPGCIIQALASDGGYLITARGLSNDATTNNAGELTAGSEAWLQVVLKPGVPNLSAAGGNE